MNSFGLTTISGKIISSDKLSDKIKVINLWATWCGPCVSEIASLNDLQRKYNGNENILFIAISDETEARIKRFLKNKEFSYLQVVDPALSNALQNGFVNSIPKHIILDKENRVRAYIDGAPKDIDKQLALTIDELLKEM